MVFESDSLETYLMQEFSRRVRVNSRYSLRAFARNLGLSPGALSEILRSRRPVTFKVAAKIAKALNLNEIEAKQLYQLAEISKRKALGYPAPKADRAELSKKLLDEDTFNLISEWHHFALLNLLDCEGFQWKASYIAKRLGLTLSKARLSMELLLRIGLVRIKGSQVKAANDFVLSPSDVPSKAVRNYHRQILEKAKEALELQTIHEREMSGIGLAVDPHDLQRMKKDISEFQDQLIAKYSKGKKQQVYFLEIALFKLTQGERSDIN